MKLSSETLNVLKNFSSINSGVFLKQGNVIETVSQNKTILAKATVKDTFPVDFGIYDLSNFLSVVSLHKDSPELSFDEKNVLIKGLGGRSKIKYRFASKDMIVIPPEKKITLPSVDIEFTLTAQDFDWMMRSANVLQSPNVAVESDGEKVCLSTFDASNDSAHSNSIEVDVNGTGKTYKMIFKTENLKMIPGEYALQISSKGISYFNNSKDNIEYWIATEAGSTFAE